MELRAKTGATCRTRCASFTWPDVRRRPLRPHEHVLLGRRHEGPRERSPALRLPPRQALRLPAGRGRARPHASADHRQVPRGEDGRRRHADDRRADRHPAALCRTEAGSGASAGSARTDVARPAPAENLKRSCRRGENDSVVKTYEQNPSIRWGFACERGKSG